MQTPQHKREYPQWQALFRSFFDRRFYVDAANNATGSGCLYLFLMCLSAALLSCGMLALSCNTLTHDPHLLSFMKQVPKMTFKDGEMSIDKPTPYDIKDANGMTTIEFRTDTKGAVNLTDNDPPIVITKDAVCMKGAKANGKVLKLSDLVRPPAGNAGASQPFTYDGDKLLDAFKGFMFAVPIIVFIVGAPCVLIGHLFQLLIYGLLAQNLCSEGEQTVPFSTGTRLAAIAITPNIVLAMMGTIILPFRFQFLLALPWAVISVIVAIVYLAISSAAVKKSRLAVPAAPQA